MAFEKASIETTLFGPASDHGQGDGEVGPGIDRQVEIDFAGGRVVVAGKAFAFSPLPPKLMEIFDAKGLVNYVKNK